MSIATYSQAQQKLLARLGIDAESRFVDVPAVDGRAHVLITGEGPPVMMVIGAGVPTVIWAPLMAELTGFTMKYAALGSKRRFHCRNRLPRAYVK